MQYNLVPVKLNISSHGDIRN